MNRGGTQQRVQPDPDSTQYLGIRINPVTGLATDYLNHFNEAIMLLDMMAQFPECIGDLLSWEPKSYSDHFAKTRLHGGQAAISAYNNAQPDVRRSLEALTDTMTTMLLNTCVALRSGLPRRKAMRLAHDTAASLKPLVALAGAVINGSNSSPAQPEMTSQMVVDRLMAD